MGFKLYYKPISYRIDDIRVRRLRSICGNCKQRKQMWLCEHMSSFLSQKLEPLGGDVFMEVDVVLLEGGESLEEFGQVNLRVPAGRQGFVWYIL